MKIIQVVGYSGSGKTTFICRLAPEMTKSGRVAIIKHMGHHTFTLEEGKDTTMHYNTGVELSVGVDDRKSVISLRTTDLYEILDLFADRGIEYALIEGFKAYPFPAVVIGDLETDRCVLRDPSVGDVLASLDKFGDYYTLPALVKEVGNACASSPDACILTFSGFIGETDGSSGCRNPEDVISGVRSRMGAADGVACVRLVQVNKMQSGECGTALYGVVAAEEFEKASVALSEGLASLRTELKSIGLEISGMSAGI